MKFSINYMSSVGSLTSRMDHKKNRTAQLEGKIPELEHSLTNKDKLVKLNEKSKQKIPYICGRRCPSS